MPELPLRVPRSDSPFSCLIIRIANPTGLAPLKAVENPESFGHVADLSFSAQCGFQVAPFLRRGKTEFFEIVLSISQLPGQFDGTVGGPGVLVFLAGHA